jgi:hypothetical protein
MSITLSFCATTGAARPAAVVPVAGSVHVLRNAIVSCEEELTLVTLVCGNRVPGSIEVLVASVVVDEASAAGAAGAVRHLS